MLVYHNGEVQKDICMYTCIRLYVVVLDCGDRFAVAMYWYSNDRIFTVELTIFKT